MSLTSSQESVDPFGHTSAQASLFSRMGFNGFIFARIDKDDHAQRLNNKTIEMIWHPRSDAGEDHYLWTAANYNGYGPPPGFNFDVFSNDEPIRDDPSLEGFNIEKRATDFVNYFKEMRTHYRSNSLLHTFGSDY